jgi:ribosomal protein S18 acetylase RimI-like enzyme
MFRELGPTKVRQRVLGTQDSEIVVFPVTHMIEFLLGFFFITLTPSFRLLYVLNSRSGQFVPMRKRKGEMERRHGFAYLSNLSVDRTFRRRGIGRHLLNQAAEVAIPISRLLFMLGLRNMSIQYVFLKIC